MKNTNPLTKKTGRLVVMVQSIVLSAIKTEVSLESDQQDKLSKFCMDAGFLSVVEKWTVFHDERHLRFDTIQYSGLS